MIPEGVFPRHGFLAVLLPPYRAFRSAGATAAGGGGLQRDIGVHVSQRHGTRLAARATVSVSSDGALEFQGRGPARSRRAGLLRTAAVGDHSLTRFRLEIT